MQSHISVSIIMYGSHVDTWRRNYICLDKLIPNSEGNKQCMEIKQENKCHCLLKKKEQQIKEVVPNGMPLIEESKSWK